MKNMLKSKIRDIPDFPKEGIIFKDITPLLQDADAFERVIAHFADRYANKGIKAIIGIESRGFIFGAPLANRLGVAFVPIRKKGKLPYKTVEMSYNLEYGSATIEMHVDAVTQGDNIVIVDDLLATGGTASAACQLVEKQGANVFECAFVVELAFLNGTKKLGGRSSYSLISY